MQPRLLRQSAAYLGVARNFFDTNIRPALTEIPLRARALAFEKEDLSRPGGHADDEPDLYRKGKNDSGRLLGGREHNEFTKEQA